MNRVLKEVTGTSGSRYARRPSYYLARQAGVRNATELGWADSYELPDDWADDVEMPNEERGARTADGSRDQRQESFPVSKAGSQDPPTRV
mmetsp:Transcript_32180/g.73741  ORF Transcript_32180/g.73741 Transcript_32180/m.73741 type:complete len:90 (+) Transcript_32180:170-439(+)